MKKILLFAAICLLSVACSPLRIVLNTKAPDGERTILTSNVPLFSYDFSTMEAALGARISGKDTVMAVLITCDKDSNHGIFDKDDRMLIRMSDNSVITLTNVYDREFEIETQTNQTQERISSIRYDYVYSPWADAVFIAPYEVSTFIPRTYITRKSNSYALYFITRQQLFDIMNKEVVKLRIEIENDEVDMPQPGNTSATFKALYDCLKECMDKSHKRPEF